MFALAGLSGYFDAVFRDFKAKTNTNRDSYLSPESSKVSEEELWVRGHALRAPSNPVIRNPSIRLPDKGI
jgi:hypothetical protein